MENMTIKQLKQIAETKGIKFSSKIKKDDLINLLKGNEKPSIKGKSFPGEY